MDATTGPLNEMRTFIGITMNTARIVLSPTEYFEAHQINPGRPLALILSQTFQGKGLISGIPTFAGGAQADAFQMHPPYPKCAKRLSPSKYALALASITSVDAPRPTTRRSPFSSCTVTSPMASVPAVTALML